MLLLLFFISAQTAPCAEVLWVHPGSKILWQDNTDQARIKRTSVIKRLMRPVAYKVYVTYGPLKLVCFVFPMTLFILETDYPSETSYPLNNLRQTDTTSEFEIELS